MRIIEIDGHRVGVISDGEDRAGPPVILLHGVAFSPRFWPPNLPPRLRETCRWYALSQPFHFPDRSVQPPEETVDADLFAKVLSEAIRTLVGEEPVVLIGHSLGGFAALNFAAREPQRVLRIISICGIAAGRGAGLVGRWQQLARGRRVAHWLFRRVWRLVISSTLALRLTLSRCAADRKAYFASPQTNATLEAMQPDMRLHDPHALQLLLGRLYDVDITPLLSRIQAPTLIIAGEQDPLISLQRQHALAEAIPHGRLRIINGCGHMYFAERPDEVAHIVDEWLHAPTGL